MTDKAPRLTSGRLRFDPLTDADEVALAALLADPKILYGFARQTWGRGLGGESARRALDLLFETHDPGGCSTLFSDVLNPGSNKVALKLGMTRRGEMSFRADLPPASMS